MFHLAITPEEKRLEYILGTQDDIWDGVWDYIRLWPHANPGLEPKYTEIFSTALINSISKETKKAEDEECGPDEWGVCGLDFMFINCAQDNLEKYFYNTIKQKK